MNIHVHIKPGTLMNIHVHINPGTLMNIHVHIKPGTLMNIHVHIKPGTLMNIHVHINPGTLMNIHVHIKPGTSMNIHFLSITLTLTLLLTTYLTRNATNPAAGTRHMTAITYRVVPDTSCKIMTSCDVEFDGIGVVVVVSDGLWLLGLKWEVGCSAGRRPIDMTSSRCC